MQVGIGAMWLNHSATSKNSGLSRYASHLIAGLLETEGDDLHVFCPREFSPPHGWVNTKRFASHYGPAMPLWRRVLWEHFGIARELNRLRPGVWLSLTPALPFSTACPRVAMVHDVIPLVYPEGHKRSTVAYAKWSTGYACRHAEALLANSHATKAELVRLFGVDPGKVHVTQLGPGNDVRPISAEDAKSEIPFSRYLLALGNLEPRKNLGRLLAAHQSLRQRFPDLGLVLVGAVRGDRATGELPWREARSLTTDGVIWYGYAPDQELPSLFAAADAFVFPSMYEGFGLPVLEAMKLGAPVVASNIPSVVEVGGDAIELFDPSSEQGIETAIQRVIEHPPLQQTMRQRGFARAQSFNWQRTVSETRAVIHQVAGP